MNPHNSLQSIIGATERRQRSAAGWAVMRSESSQRALHLSHALVALVQHAARGGKSP
jgi:hypothetical protein